MKKILAIDDNTDILEAIGEMCELKNWKAYLASNVDAGVKIFESNDIDLVIIDYHMPIVNGITGVKKIRKRCKHVPILVLTVNEDQDLANSFLENGASDFALKPLKVPDLISRISVHLKYSEKAEQTSAETEYVKGINKKTLEKIKGSIMDSDTDLTMEEVSNRSGYAYQTVHRYISYLVETGLVEITHSSGRLGRPKNKYRWKKK